MNLLFTLESLEIALFFQLDQVLVKDVFHSKP